MVLKTLLQSQAAIGALVHNRFLINHKRVWGLNKSPFLRAKKMLYVTVATLKSHLRIDGSEEDSLLSQYILAAQEEAEQRMHRAIYSETDENAVTNDLQKIPPGITQFILVAAGDLYKNRENRQEKSFTVYFQNLLDPWIRYDL